MSNVRDIQCRRLIWATPADNAKTLAEYREKLLAYRNKLIPLPVSSPSPAPIKEVEVVEVKEEQEQQRHQFGKTCG